MRGGRGREGALDTWASLHCNSVFYYYHCNSIFYYYHCNSVYYYYHCNSVPAVYNTIATVSQQTAVLYWGISSALVQ